MPTTNESSIDCKNIGLCPTVIFSPPDLSISNISYQNGLEEAPLKVCLSQFLGFFPSSWENEGPLSFSDSPEIAPDSKQT